MTAQLSAAEWRFGLKLESGKYKSFRGPFEWLDIPMFVVLSGENGAGKTHLLELLQLTAAKKRPAGLTLTHVGEEIDPGQVARIIGNLALSPAPEIGPDSVTTELKALAEAVRDQGNRDPRSVYCREHVAKAAGKPTNNLTVNEVLALLPPDALMYRDAQPMNMSSGLSFVFYRYYLRFISEVMNARARRASPTDEQIYAILGEPPWRLVNNLLSTARFVHRVADPSGRPLDQKYQFAFLDSEGTQIVQSELSSGEQSLLGLAYFLYSSGELGAFPRLLLLDEPDAHMHPGVVADYIRSIREVLVQKHGIRVIMTTHRPDTIALVPDEALYLVSRKGNRVRPAPSKAAVVSRLSSNALAVLPNARCVFVEDTDDVEFHTAVRNVATAHDGYEAAAILSFQPASVGKTPGGCGPVKTWVERLSEAGLAPLVQGLIDRDINNTGGSGIHVISRYSHENFLLDPLVIYAALADADKAPEIAGAKLGPGDEHKLCKLEGTTLQAIVDHIVSQMASRIVGATGDTFDVTYVGIAGLTLRFPVWLRDQRGKDLVGKACHPEFGMTRRELIQAFKRTKLVPTDLARMFVTMATAEYDADHSAEHPPEPHPQVHQTRPESGSAPTPTESPEPNQPA